MHCARNRPPRRCPTRFLKISSAQDQTPHTAAINRLKISRRGQSKQFSTVIRAGGLVVLPPGLIGWRPGQRVFFTIVASQLAISARPKRAQNGRFLSTHVRVVRFPMRSLALAQRHLRHCSATLSPGMGRLRDRPPPPRCLAHDQPLENFKRVALAEKCLWQQTSSISPASPT